MKITTLSIVTGTAHCNASCPFCVSKMTVPWDTPPGGKAPSVNWRNFEKAVQLAKIGECTTILLTGKGEPTLYPEMISDFLGKRPFLCDHFPFIELQTNGIPLAKAWDKYKTYLDSWHHWGMTTIAISVVHWDRKVNKDIYTPNSEYFDLPDLVEKLHGIGFAVRLTTVMTAGRLEQDEDIREIIKFCREYKVEQLTLRPVSKPVEGRSADDPTYDWIKANGLAEIRVSGIRAMLDQIGQKVMVMPHGAVVYDVDGQNVCLTDCLSVQPVSEEAGMRQLIFYPSGRLAYDWQFEGAVLI